MNLQKQQWVHFSNNDGWLSGVVTWVSSCGTVCVVQTPDNGYLYWIDLKNGDSMKVDLQKQATPKVYQLGQQVKFSNNGERLVGVATQVSPCGTICFVQTSKIGYLYLVDLETGESVKFTHYNQTNQPSQYEQNEQEVKVMKKAVFEEGEGVVVFTPYGYKYGEVTSIDNDGLDVFYEVYVPFFEEYFDFTEAEMYDLKGLVKCKDYNGEILTIVDQLDGDGNLLTIDEYCNVFVTHTEQIVEYPYITEEGNDEGADYEQDSIIQELRDMLLQRSETGIRKYGTTLDRNDLEASEWCQHALEEVLDFAGYVLRLKKDLEAIEASEQNG